MKDDSALNNLTEQIAGLSPTKRALLELQLKQKLGDVSKSRGDDLRLPPVTPDPARRYEPFPLSDIQQAYWIGRSPNLELGGVATHLYTEFDGDRLDPTRLNHAWQTLIERHEMLRAIILPDGQQQILEHVPPYQIAVLDLQGKRADEVAAELERVRAEMSHQVRKADRWPLFEIRASLLDGDRHRLHVSFDYLIVDAWSVSILFQEWQQLYQNPKAPPPPLELSFRDYLLAERSVKETDLYRRSREYWWNRLDDLPSAPDLPLAKNPQTVKRPRFVRRQTHLSSEHWQQIKSWAAQEGLTPTAVLLACFAQTLALWSRSATYTLNLTLFNRLPLHPQVNDIVGDFTSLTLLSVDCSTTGSFVERARRLRQQLAEDLNYRYVSGVEVLRELARREGGEPKALMPVVFTSVLTHGGRARERQTAWLGESGYSISQTPQVWIDSVAADIKGSLLLRWDAVDELFPNGLLDDMFAAYGRLVNRLAEEPTCWEADEVELRRELMPTWQVEQRATVNATDRAVSDEFLHTLFESQVVARPDQIAVIASNGTLTYEQLARRANQVARWLSERGARPNTLVAVVMEKGWEQVVAVLGVLTSGAAYLPIDPTLPRERLRYLLEHGEVEFALTQSCFNAELDWPGGVERLCVDANELAGVDARSLKPVQAPDDLAYVIYTSGSTGQPKGVMIEHRAAVNTILDINERFHVGPRDRVLALSSLGFDLSVYDIFGTLAAGGTIIMPEADKVRDPAHWAELIRRHEVTIWDSVPALMKLLVEYVDERPELWPRHVRLALLSGDWIPVSLPDRIKAKVEAVKVISLGGATEASIWSILYPIERVDPSWTSIPYGRPMINQRFHVLDERMLPCPVWAPGQLYIGGVGLARGYWRDEEKTNASFITNPHTGERLYRTGDLGRYLPDGNIEFLGREDFQVKIQGYRVELGEVEAALEQHPKIKTAVVTTIGESRGEKRLAAYVVSENGDTVAATQLQEFLEAKLPAYMVPSLFVTLDRLPLTPNGKVDRRALPEPIAVSDTLRAESTEAFETARPSLRIAEIAAGVLKLDELAPEVNLLRLGATSVDIIRILNRVEREFGFRPTMDAFYREPTALALARMYERTKGHSHAEKPLAETSPTGFELILDPDAREAFKNTQPGLRRDDERNAIVALPTATFDEAVRKLYEQRRSHRRFSRQPVTQGQLSRLLGCLRQTEFDGRPKYLYGSAGGLYPVQTYIYIKPERVDEFSAGVYYYHPVEHRLVVMSRGAVIEPEVYDRLINRPIFDEAAFGLFLIAQMKAITPMYGEWSAHFATIEAGLMAQLLEMTAPACGLGLCQIGVMDFARVREWFRLEESHVLVHSLLGGVVDESQLWTPTSEAVAVLDEREEGEI